jgi:hypothetical protein
VRNHALCLHASDPKPQHLLTTTAAQVLRLVVRLYQGVPQPDLAAVCRCLMALDDADEVANILARLLG